MGPTDGRSWVPEHYIPKAIGGSCHKVNIVLGCGGCNDEKFVDLWLPGHDRFRQPPTIDARMMSMFADAGIDS